MQIWSVYAQGYEDDEKYQQRFFFGEAKASAWERELFVMGYDGAIKELVEVE